MICLICNKKFKSISRHLYASHHITSEDYFLKYLDGSRGKCSICGKETSFRSISYGYSTYCSYKCSGLSSDVLEKRRKTVIERYGVDNVSKIIDVKDKIKKTSIEKYGCENPFQNKEVKERFRKTVLDKYGVSNPNQAQEVKEKKKKTYIDRFGVDNPLKCSKIKEKIKQTNFKKYGVANVFQSEIIKEKIKNTNLKVFKCENPSSNKDVKNKKRKTCFIHYGVYNPLSSQEIRERIKETCFRKYKCAHVSQNKEIKDKMTKMRKINFFNTLIKSDRLQDRCIPLFNLDEYNGVSNSKYLWKCSVCNNSFEDHLEDGHIPRCPTCYPKLQGTSIFEKEISEFCKQYFPNLIENDRTILNGKELDIYIPEIKLAIECDGLYWHSELQGVDKNYHLKKTKECEKKNIQLIHIFEDEWYNKQDIIKSILLAKMGKIKNKIYARKCIIKEVSSIEAKDFLFENHLQGSIAGASIGLYYNNELVSILTYGKPRFNKKYDIEILRFCNKKNTIVVGGLSKLSKYVKGYIISYSDSRYSLGTSYKNAGFDLVESSPPSYYYLKNFKRFSRINFQKHKLSEILENFDPTLTEWQNMQLNDYDRIWDCGNLVFEKTS